MLNRTFAVVFFTWRAKLTKDQYIQRLQIVCGKGVKRMLNRLLAKALSTWCAHSAARKKTKTLCRRIVLRMRILLLFRALDTWHANSAHTKRLKACCDKLIRRIIYRGTSVAFLSWQAGTAVKKMSARWEAFSQAAAPHQDAKSRSCLQARVFLRFVRQNKLEQQAAIEMT
jgi:hypothetical protein